MKYFIKKFFLVIVVTLIINVPLIVCGTLRTNKTVTLKGDTTVVDNFVEIDNAYKSNGSLSTIYVISMDHSTVLQNFILNASKTSEIDDMSDNYLHFSNEELNKMSRIQHESSIMYSLILAYKEAKKIDSNINLDFTFESVVIAYYGPNSSFRIGDKIVGVNDINIIDCFDKFKKEFNETQKDGTIYHVLRDNKKIDIPYSKENFEISIYSYYDLDDTNCFPKYKIIPSSVGGPSGGLLQTLSLYNSLIEEDITKGYKIAGTGTINNNGDVGKIGGIKQKIYTAYDDNIDIFLCPSDNYDEALIAYNNLPKNNKMRLYKVSTFNEALEVLKNA